MAGAKWKFFTWKVFPSSGAELHLRVGASDGGYAVRREPASGTLGRGFLKQNSKIENQHCGRAKMWVRISETFTLLFKTQTKRSRHFGEAKYEIGTWVLNTENHCRVLAGWLFHLFFVNLRLHPIFLFVHSVRNEPVSYYRPEWAKVISVLP